MWSGFNKRYSYLFLILFQVMLFTNFSAQIKPSQSHLKVVKIPIIWDSTRIKLSLDYMAKHHDLHKTKAEIEPKMIVIHWTAIPTLEGSFRAFNPSILPGRPKLQSASALNVGIHYLVDREGTIYQLLPETYFARHVIGLNYCAIGIENVADGGDHPITKKQLKANIRIIKYLKLKYPQIEYVIGHHEYRQFKDHPIYRETDPNYYTIKSDPGDEYMEKLYRKIKKLNVRRNP